jgi:hypothetical protein
MANMKIILSRKGFDTVNGGCASPYMQDGTLLSLPIPSDDNFTYADFAYNGLSYDRLLKQLNPKKEYSACHIDPDIRGDIWLTVPDNWQPAFGQIDSAQGQLRNQGVGAGDLFLFFGWFKQVRQTLDGEFRFVIGAPNLHVIYGYLQVERVLTQPNDIIKYGWHPHADGSRRGNKTNALYLARKTLSFDGSKPGCGVLNFTENRVLTLDNCSMGTWKETPALMPTNIVTKRKNSANGRGIYYKGIWQEMVLKENEESEAWAMSML